MLLVSPHNINIKLGIIIWRTNWKGGIIMTYPMQLLNLYRERGKLMTWLNHRDNVSDKTRLKQVEKEIKELEKKLKLD